jgi:hypothetical protein
VASGQMRRAQLSNVTLNRDQDITGVFAGELFAEHEQACVCSIVNCTDVTDKYIFVL